MIRIDYDNRRVFVLGRRLHHGLAGMAFVGVGLVLALHDWKDRKDWLRTR